MKSTLAELAVKLRVAERELSCGTAPNWLHIALLRRVIARDLPPLTYGGNQ